MKLTPQELYEKLVNEHHIIGAKGGIQFRLNDFEIAIESKDSIGNLIQEWLKGWMVANDVEFESHNNTQDFPDFFLDPSDKKTGLLEVKSFDYNKTANFDVANFMAYRRSLHAHPYRLNSYYLIFGYKMTGKILEIAGIWLKRVWEITGPSEDWPLKCQVKQGEVVNIRPVKWYNNDKTKFKSFNSALEFVKAFDATQRQWNRTERDPLTNTWLRTIKKGYQTDTGIELL